MIQKMPQAMASLPVLLTYLFEAVVLLALGFSLPASSLKQASSHG
jgi:hypothetical protein